MFEVKHEIERILNVNINAWIPCEICFENEPRHQNNKWCQCVDLESTYQKHVAMLLEKSSREDQLTFSTVNGFCHPTLTWLAQFRKKKLLEGLSLSNGLHYFEGQLPVVWGGSFTNIFLGSCNSICMFCVRYRFLWICMYIFRDYVDLFGHIHTPTETLKGNIIFQVVISTWNLSSESNWIIFPSRVTSKHPSGKLT